MWQADHGIWYFAFSFVSKRDFESMQKFVAIMLPSHQHHIGIILAFARLSKVPQAASFYSIVVLIFQLFDVSFRRLRFVPKRLSSETGSHL